MNIADVAARLQALPPELPDPSDRFQQVQERVRRRRTRRRAGAAVVAVAALAVLVPTAIRLLPDPAGDPSRDIATEPSAPETASPAGEHIPGKDRVIDLSEPLTTQGTGNLTVQLGERPEGATAVSTDLRCLSAGSFTWPDGASMECNAEDAAAEADRPISPGYIIDLEPGQTEIQIEAGADESWQIVTTYVRVEHTDWAVNANGETYGVNNERGSPDLVAVAGPGHSYVREVDLNAGPRNPDEAQEWMRTGELYAIPTYTSDGSTIVSTFEFAEAIVSSGQPEGSGGAEDGDDIRLVSGAPPPGTVETSATGQLTLTEGGCVHLDTEAGKRWLILPWGVHLVGTPADGRLQTLDGTLLAELNADTSLTGEELPGQQSEARCATGLPPLYVTIP